MKYKLEIKWALIFFTTSLVWMVLERMVGLHGAHIDKHATYTNLFALVAILVYVLAIRDKRDTDLGGVMSWMDGFKSGAIISLMVMVLTPLAQVLTAKVITPDYFQNAIQYGVENNLTTLEEAQDYFSLKNYIMIASISAPLMGMVTSAVVAFFVKSPEVSES